MMKRETGIGLAIGEGTGVVATVAAILILMHVDHTQANEVNACASALDAARFQPDRVVGSKLLDAC